MLLFAVFKVKNSGEFPVIPLFRFARTEDFCGERRFRRCFILEEQRKQRARPPGRLLASPAGPDPPELPEQLAGFGELGLQRVEQAGLRRRGAIGVTGAESPELSRVTRKGGVIERQGQSGAGTLF